MQFDDSLLENGIPSVLNFLSGIIAPLLCERISLYLGNANEYLGIKEYKGKELDTHREIKC